MATTPLQVSTSGPEQAEFAIPDAQAVMSKSRLENFRVANPVLPRALRADLYALYGFARLVDDIGDEAQGDRLAALDWLDSELDALYAGSPRHELIRRLQPTVAAHGIPAGPLRRLIEANRRDQRITRYRTFDELVDYCTLSANPVGHLVLYVFDSATPDRIALSDSVCTALQVVEHLQDVAEDLGRGRVYLPLEDMEGHGCSVEDLNARPTPEGVRRVVAFEGERARRLLNEGAPLARMLPWRAGLAVAGFVAGGHAALDAIERSGHDVLSVSPHASQLSRLGNFVTTLIRLART